MANPAPTINQINAFNATQGTTIDFNIIGGTELVRSNKIYIYDLSDNSLICTHLYVSTESIHELPPNTDGSIVYESGKSSADFVNGAQYYAQIQTFTDIGGTEGGSGLSVSKLFWCLVDPSLTIDTIPSSISTTSYNVSATYDANTSVVSNIIQQYQFSLYSATGSLLQSSGVVVGNGEQQGTSTAYDISYNFSGLSVGSSYYVAVDVTTTQGMSISAQSNTFTVSIDIPTLGEATVVNNACDGYISVTSNLSSEYGGSASGEIATFETDSVNNVTKLEVTLEPIQEGTGDPSPSNVRPIVGHSSVAVEIDNGEDTVEVGQDFNVTLTPTVIDETPYLFKKTGDVRGDRESLELVGGTVNWNQLIQKYTEGTVTSDGITFTVGSDGKVKVTGTATSRASIGYGRTINVIKDHVYFMNGAEHVVFHDGTWAFDTGGKKGGTIGKAVSTVPLGFTIEVLGAGNVGVAIDTSFYPNVTDLTAFFGNSATADYVYGLEQANAGAGIAWLRKYFPDLFAYSPYNTGTLESVKPTAHVTRGKNQCNATNPITIGSGGGNIGNQPCVLPAGTYTYSATSSTIVAFQLTVRDGNGNNIGQWSSPSSVIGRHSITFTITEKAAEIRCYYNSATVISDIQVEVGSTATPYEPYESHTYPITELELRGIPKLVDGELRFDGDTRKADGTVTRKYGIVDLGTLSWGNPTERGEFRGYLKSSDPVPPSVDVNTIANAICEKYIMRTGAQTYSGTYDKSISVLRSYLSINDSSYSTGTALKESLSGVYLVYEIGTPTTETADPFADPQEVSIYGTEEFVSSNGVPVGNKTTYKTRDIFGGTIDLASGVLTVDRLALSFGSVEWTNYKTGGYRTSAEIPNIVDNTSSVDDNKLLCSMYKTMPSSATLQNGEACIAGRAIFCVNTNYPNDAGAFREAMGEQIAVYKLKTPLTYQLTPHEIETLIGTNNVWSNAGDVLIEFNIPITNLLVKRQDVDDVSGNWLTLYSQPVEQASDMDFTFIDFLNQYGKKYKYALVPLLTQTQSGVEVEVEGGYTVSDEVQSIFDGVYIGDSTGVQRLKAGVAYNNLNTNQQVGVIPTLGNKYPIIVSNGNIQYDTGSVSGLIVPDDFYSNGNLSRLDMSDKRGVINDFLTNKKPKILKDWNGNIWLVVFTDNVDVSFDNNYGMGVATFTSGWTEVGDPTNQEDLQRTGLINVGGD